MIICSQLQKMLRDLRADGKTNRELAEIAGISHAHINRLLNGPPENLLKVKLETLLRLFPELEKCITHDSICAPSGIGIANGDHATVNNYGNADALRTAIISAVLDSGIHPECIVRICQIIRDTNP